MDHRWPNTDLGDQLFGQKIEREIAYSMEYWLEENPLTRVNMRPPLFDRNQAEHLMDVYLECSDAFGNV